MAQMHVLLVGGTPETRRCLALAASDAGLRFSWVASETAALCIMQEQRVEALLADGASVELSDDFVHSAASIQPFLKVLVLVDPDGRPSRPRRICSRWVCFLPKPSTVEAAEEILAGVAQACRRCWACGASAAEAA